MTATEPPTANILLVDDQEKNLLALEAVLAPLGHHLIRARSGVEALKRLLTEEFALVLLDVEMPNLNGYETAREIKQRPSTSHLPIIFITAVSTERHEVFRGYSAGAVDYVVKPVDPEILRSKVGIFVDLHLKEAALHESEERFRRAFDDAPIGMGLVGGDGRWLRVNRALCAITGYSEEGLLGRSVQADIHADDQPANAHGMREVLAGNVKSYRLEQRHRHADGHFVWVVLSASSIRDPAHRPLYLIAQVEDVTMRKEAEAELTHQAFHDTLTGLANRALFLDRLGVALRRFERHGSSVAVLFMDVDRFKVINDSLGHDRGDQLLRAVGRRIKDLTRPTDTVARFGGDEFTILCEETDEHAAVGVAQRILDSLSQPFDIDGAEAFVTASIGIVVCSDPGADLGHLVGDADAAMYRAKENGKNRYEIFDSRMRARATQRLATENALHRALARAEFRVFYQPVVDLESEVVRGVEALVRWEHPQRGLLLPEEFVPLAEETGMIVPIGKWVIEGACLQVGHWQQDRAGAPLELSVNLSGRQFLQPDLVELVAGALDQAQLEPSLVCLEVTETVLLQDSEETMSVLAALKDLGVRIGIDDFGTGYSSLSYLKRFAVDELKVDKTFVDGLSRDPNNAPILAAIVTLAEALDLAAVAEGVETAEQAREVRKLGLKSAQGFYFARPQSACALGEVLAAKTGSGNAVPAARSH